MQALKAIGALDRLRELLEVVRVVGCLKEFRGLLEAVSVNESGQIQT